MLAQTSQEPGPFVSSNQLNQLWRRETNKTVALSHQTDIQIINFNIGARPTKNISPLKHIMYRTCSFCYQDVLLISSVMESLPQVFRLARPVVD